MEKVMLEIEKENTDANSLKSYHILAAKAKKQETQIFYRKY